MPQFVPAVIGVAASAAAAGAAVSGTLLATTILGGALTIGSALSIGLTVIGGVLQFVLNRASRPASPRPRPQEVQATLADPTSPRWYDYGRVRRGGRLVYWDRIEGTGSGKVLWRTIVTDCQECDAIEERQLNNEPLTLDGSGFVTAPTKWASSRVQVIGRIGEASQTYVSEIESDLPVWTSTHRGDGLCYVAIRQAPVDGATVNAGEVYPNYANGEVYTETARAAKDVYDPRDASTGWSRNAVLVLLWALRHPQFGGRALTDFALETWKTAATTAEQSITDVDGVSQLTYALSGRIQTPTPDRRSSEIADVIRDLLVALDATLYDDPTDDGKVAIRIGAALSDPRPPLTTDQIITFQDSSDQSVTARYDAVRVRYTEPALDYQEHITPAYGYDGSTTGWIADSTALSVLTVPIPEIDRMDQAQRIAKKLYLRQVAQRATVEVNMAGILYSVGDPISFDLPHLNDTGVWRVTDREVSFSPDGASVLLSVEKVDVARYDAWDPSTEGEAAPTPAVISGSASSAIAAPSCFRAAATAGDMVRVAWDPPSSGSTNIPITIEVSATGAGSYDSTFSSNPQSSNVSSLECDTSGESTNIDIRAKFDNGAGTESAYSSVLSNVDRAAPVSAQAAPTLVLTSQDRNDAVFTVTPAADASNWKIQLLLDGVVTKEVSCCDDSAKTVPYAFSAYGSSNEDGGNYRVVTARVMNLSGNASADSAPVNFYIVTGNEA